MSSRRMSLLPRATLHSDSEQLSPLKILCYQLLSFSSWSIWRWGVGGLPVQPERDGGLAQFCPQPAGDQGVRCQPHAGDCLHPLHREDQRDEQQHGCDGDLLAQWLHCQPGSQKCQDDRISALMNKWRQWEWGGDESGLVISLTWFSRVHSLAGPSR